MKKLILAVFAMILLAGCMRNRPKAELTNLYQDVYIDTISIHGEKHEMLFWIDAKEGTMMHSPECWCKKGE